MMRRLLTATALLCTLAGSAAAQPSTFRDSLLDRLAGTWVLQGQIAGKATTHDVVSEWVLGHQYLQLHELSREKDAAGQARYEAVVFIGWDQPSGQYSCLWLDSTGGGGLSAQAIGRAERSGQDIPFVFKEPDDTISFHNTFSYDRATDSWAWLMDNTKNGKPVPFGRVRLTRK